MILKINHSTALDVINVAVCIGRISVIFHYIGILVGKYCDASKVENTSVQQRAKKNM